VDTTSKYFTNQRSRFIAIEGVDGAGKGVQSLLLVKKLREEGLEVLLTREPGGAPGAEEIRSLLVNGEVGRWDAMTELLLINAARRNHLQQTILPALAAGTWVVCDRYIDSTKAFQGYAGNLSLMFINELHSKVTENFNPDITFVLDIDPETSLARAQQRASTEDRFEKKGLSYQQTVRRGFLELAENSPETHILLNAEGTVDEVHLALMTALYRRLEQHP
jgi:dTMP kinase